MHAPGTDLSQRDKLMNMDLEKFRRSLNDRNPPACLTLPLTGLWWDAKENWAKAHEAAQRDEGPQGSWVHAYLHRKEGDATNASYWYQRAGKPVSRRSLEEEWIEIAQALLAELGP